jgi:hypothetical protein
MADYYFVLDGPQFEGETRPALAGAWRLRHFDPAQTLCVALVPAARDFSARFHIGGNESLISRIAKGTITFDRPLWRALVAEILLVSAVEIPEFQVSADTLRRLLAPARYAIELSDRSDFEPIEQALRGARDLTFGATVYRPEHAGYNSALKVTELAHYLAAVRPQHWTPSDLAGARGLAIDEYADELAFAREWFPALVEMYNRAAGRGQVIVYESIF